MNEVTCPKCRKPVEGWQDLRPATMQKAEDAAERGDTLGLSLQPCGCPFPEGFTVTQDETGRPVNITATGLGDS